MIDRDQMNRLERALTGIRDELGGIRKALETANEPGARVLTMKPHSFSAEALARHLQADPSGAEWRAREVDLSDEAECPECDPDFHPFGKDDEGPSASRSGAR